MEYLSKERYKELTDELNYLISEEYPKIREEVAEMSAQGDRSENDGYRQARRNQAKLIRRVNFLQKLLQHSRVIDTNNLPKDRVTILSTVQFTNLSTNKSMTFKLVSHHEMDLEKGRISIQSPIGSALMGKKEGDIVQVDAPALKFEVRIDKIINE